jgi:hypothetical protein
MTLNHAARFIDASAGQTHCQTHASGHLLLVMHEGLYAAGYWSTQSMPDSAYASLPHQQILHPAYYIVNAACT